MKFRNHPFASCPSMMYVDTCIGYDIYIQTETFRVGAVFAVYGNEDWQNYSGIDMGMKRMAHDNSETPCGDFIAAAAIAFLKHPELVSKYGIISND